MPVLTSTATHSPPPHAEGLQGSPPAYLDPKRPPLFLVDGAKADVDLTWGARLQLPVHPRASPPVPGLTALQVNPCLPPGLRDATWPCAYHPDHCSQAATATSVLSTSSALSPSSRQGLQAAPGNLHLDKRDRCQMERAALLQASQAPGTWAQASRPPAASQLLGLRDQVSGSQC